MSLSKPPAGPRTSAARSAPQAGEQESAQSLRSPWLFGGVIEYQLPGVSAPPVLLAALGPRMLALAGELTDGTVTAWTGPKTLDTHIVPRITAAAEASGRGAPQVIASLAVGVTDDVDAARADIAERFGMSESFPSYRAMLDIEGGDGVVELAAVGDEAAVAAAVARYADAGVTELVVMPVGSADERRRTIDLLTSLPR